MAEAVAEIRRRMDAAAREAGRDPASVQLCAACKTHTPETIALSAQLPIDLFGENHVQELCANFDAGATRYLRVTSSAICRPTRSKRCWGRRV